MTARYAIYYTPADTSTLARFGAAVLGRDATSYKERSSTEFAPFPDLSLWRSYTKKPAHYGFHATIKAPFELAADCTAADLLSELSSFCANCQSIALTDLEPTMLHSFSALAMPVQPKELVDFAASVVRHFEPFRQALTSADIARRQTNTLSPSQADNLEHFGYPYIFEDFQFHMTLSDALPQDEQRFLPWVQSAYHQMVTQTPMLDRLCVFRQVDRSTPFVRIAEFRLASR